LRFELFTWLGWINMINLIILLNKIDNDNK